MMSTRVGGITGAMSKGLMASLVASPRVGGIAGDISKGLMSPRVGGITGDISKGWWHHWWHLQGFDGITGVPDA